MSKPGHQAPPAIAEPAIIGWSHPVAAIPERGLDEHQTAPAEVLEAVRDALDILACRRIEVRYKVRSAGAGCYRVNGHLDALVTQACVATTDPVEQAIACDFDAVFHPPEDQKHNRLDEDEDPLATTDTDTIENGAIPVGRLIYEEIASRLDPYPRLPGASLDWQDKDMAEPQRNTPFAALARLKQRPDGES